MLVRTMTRHSAIRSHRLEIKIFSHHTIQLGMMHVIQSFSFEYVGDRHLLLRYLYRSPWTTDNMHRSTPVHPSRWRFGSHNSGWSRLIHQHDMSAMLSYRTLREWMDRARRRPIMSVAVVQKIFLFITHDMCWRMGSDHPSSYPFTSDEIKIIFISNMCDAIGRTKRVRLGWADLDIVMVWMSWVSSMSIDRVTHEWCGDSSDRTTSSSIHPVRSCRTCSK